MKALPVTYKTLNASPPPHTTGQNEQVRIALGRPPPGRLGRGVRILALDGGGMRGAALVEHMRQIERRCGRPVHELFDVIGGTSTGALLAVAVGVLRYSLDACHEVYALLGREVFGGGGGGGQAASSDGAAATGAASSSAATAAAVAADADAAAAAAGWRDALRQLYATGSHTVRLAVSGCKHDAAPYEALLRARCRLEPLGAIGDAMIDAALLGGPYVFATATLASSRPAAPFVFRTYELPDEAAPAAAAMRACAGSSRHAVWQAVRASSAAPYYLDDFSDGALRFQDGATTANNPGVVALQQARLLFPDAPIDALVSLGCGAPPPEPRARSSMHSMVDTGALLIEAACSTERADEALSAALPLVPGLRYYRFEARHAHCAMRLDDVSAESARRLLAATTRYCARPDVAAAYDELAALLLEGASGAGGGGEDDDVSGGGGGGGGGDGEACGSGEAGLATTAAAADTAADAAVPATGGSDGEAAPRGAAEVTAVAPPSPGAGPSSTTAAAAASPAQSPGRSGGGPVLAAPRLGTARGVLLVEAPRCGFEEAAGPVEAAAAAVGRLPQLLRRCNLLAIVEEAERQQVIAAQREEAAHKQEGQKQQPPRQQQPQQQAAAATSWLGRLFTASAATTTGSSGANEQGSKPAAHPLDAAAAAHAAPPAAGALAGTGTAAAAAAAQGGAVAAAAAPPPPPDTRERLVAAMTAALSSVAGRAGVVHLALHRCDRPGPGADGSGGALVGAWGSRVLAVVEPSDEAARLAAEIGRAAGDGGGSAGAVTLGDALRGRTCVCLGGGGGNSGSGSGSGSGALLSVLSEQRARTPAGRLVTSWVLQATEPHAGALLDARALQPLAPKLARMVVTSAAPLPPAFIRAVLHAGARAVVSASEAAAAAPAAEAGSAATTAADVEGFFSALFEALLDGAAASVPEAIAAAEAARPTLSGRFVCHHL